MSDCSVCVEAEIDATPERVWEVLKDVAGYQGWSKSFWFTGAKARVGGAAVLWACVRAPLPAAPIPVKFQVMDRNRELRWGGKIPLIAGGSHYLRLEDLGDGRTRVIHGEDFSGVVPRITWPLLGRLLPQAYQQFLDELADQVAAQAG